MKAFTDTPVTKEEYTRAAKSHRARDILIQYAYWSSYRLKGCSVGCMIDTFLPDARFLHAHNRTERFPELFGIPTDIAIMTDDIFEGLPLSQAVDFHVAVAEAIPEGATYPDANLQQSFTKHIGDQHDSVKDYFWENREHPYDYELWTTIASEFIRWIKGT